jgi:hypothetical protein
LEFPLPVRAHNQWWERPNRILLINLREGDEPRIDARALVRDAQSFSATAFCINGGGIVAFYQTSIPGHRVSSGLRGRDLLAEVIPAAHEAGLHVLARIDPSCAPKALAAAHPEWFTRNREGRYCEVSGHYVTCPNAAYYHERMVDVVQEILTRYDADGIWNNQGKFAAWETGPCYCDTCQRLFRDDSGLQLPREENWQDPAWRRYNEWRYQRIAQWVKRMHEAIHAVKQGAVFISAIQLIESLETIRPGGWDVDYWVDHQDVLAFECQRRNTAPWWPGIQAKYLSSLAPEKPRWMTASYFYPWWRLSASPAEENRPWIAQQFANGVCTWLHINGGYSELFDRRGFAPMREVFARQACWEPYFDGAVSDARVALIFSRHTQDHYGAGDPHARYLDFLRGWYCALQEAHVPFDVISDKFLSAQRLQRYRVLIVSNLACVADDSVRVLEDFIARGGALVASYEAGFCDLDGNRRDSPAFARLLGGTYAGHRDNLKSSYAKLEDRGDPLLAGLGDTDLIPNEGALVELHPSPGSNVPLTLIPPVIAHSGATISIPELSAIRETTTIPAAVHARHGLGHTIYFANQMECLYYRYGFRDLGLVLGNAVRHALGEAGHVEITAPDFIDMSLMRQGKRRLVHLINLPVDKPLNTGWRHPGRNLVPVTGIEVKLKIESAERVREVRAATSERPLEFVQEGAWVRVTAPRLEDHEIIVFEIA